MAIATAREFGVALFDTANIYGDGRAESLLGDALEDDRDVVVISKCGYVSEAKPEQDFSADGLRRAAEASLERLGRSQHDVLLLHSPPRDVLRGGDAFATLDSLRDDGIARRTGVSLRSLDDFPATLAWPGCDVVELILNLLDQRALDFGIPERAAAEGIDLVARVPLCFGFLSGTHAPNSTFGDGDQRSRWSRKQLDAWAEGAGRYRFLVREGRTLAQAALAWAADQPGVLAAIPGMKTPEQVRENVFARKVVLEPDELAAIRAVWAELGWVVPR